MAIERNFISSYEFAENPYQCITILLVDDSLYSSITSNMLEARGHRVIGTGSSVEAAEIARAQEEEIQLVITEILLEDMDGKFVLLDDIVKNLALPVIVLTSDNEEDVALECLLRGAELYLLKPVKMTDFEFLWQFQFRRRDPNSDSDSDWSFSLDSGSDSSDSEPKSEKVDPVPTLPIPQQQTSQSAANIAGQNPPFFPAFPQNSMTSPICCQYCPGHTLGFICYPLYSQGSSVQTQYPLYFPGYPQSLACYPLQGPWNFPVQIQYTPYFPEYTEVFLHHPFCSQSPWNFPVQTPYPPHFPGCIENFSVQPQYPPYLPEYTDDFMSHLAYNQNLVYDEAHYALQPSCYQFPVGAPTQAQFFPPQPGMAQGESA